MRAPEMVLQGKFNQILVLVLVNLAGLAAIIIAAEVIWGDWFTAYVPPHTAVVDRTYTFNQSLYEPFGKVIYVRDRYGLRGVREPLSEVQLVTVGGSTTDQHYIGEGKTWQDALQDRSGIKVANAGVDGMSSFGHLIAVTEWLHRLPNFSPHYYLHYIGVNDASLSNDQTESNWSGTKSPLLFAIRKRSIVARSLIKLWFSATPPREINHGAIKPPANRAGSEMIKVTVDPSDIERYIEKFYKPNLRSLIALHHSRGEKAIFVSQPVQPAIVAWKGNDVLVSSKFAALGHWALALSLVNTATEAVCRETADCLFIDLAHQLRFADSDFYDLVHNTPAGAYKVGVFLAEKLAFIRTNHL
jgi:hypothetical protein